MGLRERIVDLQRPRRCREVEKATADTDVLENIRAAPIAYMKFFSKIAFLLFVFSLAFYFVFNTILVNPIFAVVGAVTVSVIITGESASMLRF